MDNENNSVSFQVHEGAMARMDRSNKRLLIALIIVVICMLINNVVWIAYINHRQDVQSQQVNYATESESR